MGTRSNTVFKVGDNIVGGFYAQYDGYPTGHGAELKKILGDVKLSNGIQSGAHNGVPCLAMTVIKHIKDGAGGFYLQHFDPDAEGAHFNDYTYVLYQNSYDDFELKLRLYAGNTVIFDGPWGQFNPNTVEAADEDDND